MDTTNTQTSTVATEGTTQNAAQAAITDWRTSIPEDIRNEPSLQHITDVGNLAKSYVNAQKMVGQDKIPLPTKYATDQDWTNVFNKLGRPDSPDKYEIKPPQGKSFDDNILKEFKQAAHAANLLPQQVQKVIDWYGQVTDKVNQQVTEKTQAERVNAENALKTEWGNAFDTKVSKARQALKDFADPNDIKYIEESGLGNNPVLIKMLAKMGESVSEDKFRGDAKTSVAQTPAEALAEFNKILHNMDHPYHNRKHPAHYEAQAEMQKLSQAAFPESN
jgi:hypothetical protein